MCFTIVVPKLRDQLPDASNSWNNHLWDYIPRNLYYLSRLPLSIHWAVWTSPITPITSISSAINVPQGSSSISIFQILGERFNFKYPIKVSTDIAGGADSFTHLCMLVDYYQAILPHHLSPLQAFLWFDESYFSLSLEWLVNHVFLILSVSPAPQSFCDLLDLLCHPIFRTPPSGWECCP